MQINISFYLWSGAIIVAEYVYREQPHVVGGVHASQAVMVRIADAQAECEHVKRCGAEVLQGPTDWPYGEWQYVVRDIGGHCWTFMQTLVDIAPEEWGGESITPVQG